jgi:acyl carrier protein
MDTSSEARVISDVRAVISDMAPTPVPIEPSSHLIADLGFHSLALMELAFALEERFALPPIDEGAAGAIKTVGDVERHVLQHLA